MTLSPEKNDQKKEYNPVVFFVFLDHTITLLLLQTMLDFGPEKISFDLENELKVGLQD